MTQSLGADCYGRCRDAGNSHESCARLCRDKSKSLSTHARIAGHGIKSFVSDTFESLSPEGYSECLARQQRGSTEPCDPYERCGKRPTVYDLVDRRLARPTGKPAHLSDPSLYADYHGYVAMPIAPYPPGGTPSGSAAGLNISSEEWARLYKESDYYECQVDVNIRHAARLQVDWKFWVGLGAAGLGMTLLALGRK